MPAPKPDGPMPAVTVAVSPRSAWSEISVAAGLTVPPFVEKPWSLL